MNCHLCGQPAIDRCYTCGQLFCEAHGSRNCTACDHGVREGDPRPDRISTSPFSVQPAARTWWRPQEAEDYVPPACYVCKGLTRSTCRNCGRMFCAQHAGSAELCRECHVSGTVTFLAFGFVVLLVVIATVWGYLRTQ
jgi:hypothetical protein